MRIGLVSDIHGNLEALETVLENLKDRGADRIFCLGDLVGYGPDPVACVERIMKSADIILAGNHDMAAAGCVDINHFNTHAREAIEWTQRSLSPQIRKILAGLPLTVTEESMVLVHATPYEPEAWHYMLTEAEARRGFAVQDQPVCFLGHSHIPTFFIQEPRGNLHMEMKSSIRLEKDRRYIINVGSVGQPRDNDARACAAIFDTETSEFTLERLAYPVWLVQEKMSRHNLPMALIERLSYGM